MKLRAHILKHSYPLIRLYWRFQRNSRGVAVVVLHQNEVLLIRHSYGNPGWSIPGGGINRRETPEDAALREMREEVGIYLEKIEGSAENPIAGPRGGKLWVYWGEAPSKEKEIDGVEIIESKWFPLDALPQDLLLRAKQAIAVMQKK